MNKEDKIDVMGFEVAVIGMSARFPGARHVHEFWENLKNGMESISFFCDQELKEAGIDIEMLENPNYVGARGILQDIEYFDSFFFDYTPKEAEIMDPQMRIFHECAWEALEDAAYDPDSYNGLIGLYAGAGHNHYWEGLCKFSGKLDEVGYWTASPLIDKDYLGMRVSYKLNLLGPCFSLYTACSTSLVAVHLAVSALISGECDITIAGGITVIIPQQAGYLYREGMILSPDGHCRAFDSGAKGTVAGNGVGIVVLKRLEEAIRQQDHIYAVIKGSAVNNDGIRKSGFTAPSIEGQVEVIQMAQQMARVEPESISYVETHGTGTTLGDPIEIQALKLAFNTDKKGFCRIGSVKTNIGHLDTAAGAAGLIKTVLALKHRQIPPSLYFKTPNPKIDFENSPFSVNDELVEWENRKYPLRAGVSSFGIGGTNAHVVLEEWPTAQSAERMAQGTGSQGRGGVSPPSSSRRYQLILLSAKTETALDRMTRNLAHHFKKNPGIELADAAYTLQVGRKAFLYRRMLMSPDTVSSIDILESAARSDTPGTTHDKRIQTYISKQDKRPIFMFPGQGSQYINMALELYQSETVFKQETDRCLEILKPLTGYDIKEILYPGIPVSKTVINQKLLWGVPDASRGGFLEKSPPGRRRQEITQTEIAQPVIFVIEYALAKLLMHWGIKPYAMIGHSIGEYTAACLAGVFSLEDALKLVTIRGKLMRQLPKGAMLSIPLPEQELIPLLNSNSELSLAAVNSFSHCVVSGPPPVIEAFARQMKEQGYDTRLLHTSHAFHSKMMDPIVEAFKDRVKEIKINKPAIPYISNVSGKWITIEEAVNPGYWAIHLRRTVRFLDGITRLLKEENAVFIEVGPGRALAAFVNRHPDKKPGQQVVNLVRHPGEKVSDSGYLLNKVGQLWLWGQKLDWRGFYTGQKRNRLPLPTYPFEGRRYWLEGDLPGTGSREKLPGKPGRVKRTNIAEWFYIPSWKRSILQPGQTREKTSQSNWLVFLDDGGTGFPLVKHLPAGNREVITVKPGIKFMKTGVSQFCLNPGQPGDYNQLLSELGKLNKIPDKIIHLWNVNTKAEAEETGWDSDEKYLELGFYSLLYLARAIGNQTVKTGIEIIVLTDNMQDVIGGELLYPQKAVVLGPVMVVPKEYPQISCRSIDIVVPGAGSAKERNLISRLKREFNSGSPDTIVAYRNNHRLVQTFEAVPLQKSLEPAHRLKQRGVYLVTGGWGGIGLTLAEHLAKTVKAKLILTGRSSFPPRAEWDKWSTAHHAGDDISRKIKKIRELEKLGAEVLIFSADSADYRQMRQVIREAEQRLGKINGVIHAAGVPGRGTIRLKTKEMADNVLRPKVKGTLVLHKIFKDSQPDFFILCSSINSILSLVGQVDYCAANVFLDAFACYKTALDSDGMDTGTGTFTVSINWDTWQELGMAVEAVKKFTKTPAKTGYRSLKIPHPLLEQYSSEEADKERYRSLFKLDRYWVLKEHTVKETGDGLLPGVTYIEMARAAYENHMKTRLEDRDGPFGPVEIKDVRFTNPLLLKENEEKEVQLTLTKQPAPPGGFEFVIRSRAASSGDEKSETRFHMQTHATGKIKGPGANKPGTHDIKEIEALCQEKEWIVNRENNETREGLLKFGPRWKNLKWVKYGNGRALAFLELNEEYEKDLESYRLHPALLDVATGFFHPYIRENSDYIPFSYKQLRINGHLPRRIFCYSRFTGSGETGKDLLTFDITIMDEQGIQRVDIQEFTLLEVSPRVKTRIEAAGIAPEGREAYLRAGIRPLEGIEVLERIMEAALPRIVVSTSHLMTRLEQHNTAPPPPLEEMSRQDNALPAYTRPEMSSPYVPPTTPTEKILAITWQNLLGVEKVGIHDDFFELGGDSLKAISLLGRIHKKSGTEISLTDFFNRPTIKKLALYIDKHSQKDIFYPIAPVEKREYHVLSSAQKRLFILHHIDKNSTVYNLTEVFLLKDLLDKRQLEETFRRLVRRHESLRTSFHMAAGQPVQKVHENLDFEIQNIDFKTAPVKVKVEIEEKEEPHGQIPNFKFQIPNKKETDGHHSSFIIHHSFIRPFDLSEAPLLRVGLLEISQQKYLLAVDVHHIVHDGTSQALFFKEFCSLYAGKDLPGLQVRYKDYAQWQNRKGKDSTLKEQENYWLREFALPDQVPALNLPLDYPRPSIQDYEGKVAAFAIDREKTHALKTFAVKKESTLFILLLSIYYVFLSKLSSQEDITIGTPVAGRKHPDLHHIIGMFLNTLALRNFPSGNKSFAAFLREVKERTLRAFDHQDYPFEELVEKAAVKRDLSRNPLFDAMFILHTEFRSAEAVGVFEQEDSPLKMEPYGYEKNTSEFDFIVVGVERDDYLAFKIEYRTKLFNGKTIERFINYFKNLVSAVLENPAGNLWEIDIMSKDEKRQVLVVFNDTAADYPGDKTIHRRFEEQAGRTPDIIAAVEPPPIKNRTYMTYTTYITYRELHEQSHHLAYLLKEKGVKPDTIVGLLAERSVEMIMAIFGILKAGGAYLPIDPEYPRERIDYMLADAKVNILVKKGDIISDLENRQKLFVLDFEHLNFESVSNFDIRISDLNTSNLLYIIYTSGSTGNPKGVTISHQNVVNFFTGMSRVIDFAHSQTMLALTTISFDISVLEILFPLVQGMKVLIAGKEAQSDPALLAGTIVDNRVDIMQITPSHLKILTDVPVGADSLLKIKILLVGGETLPQHLFEGIQQLERKSGGKIYNMYGPTETTIWSTVKDLTGAKTVTIGSPIANTRVYILDRHHTPQPIGIPGELSIGGDGISRGYLNNIELTAEKFCLRRPGGSFCKNRPLDPRKNFLLVPAHSPGKEKVPGKPIYMSHLSYSSHISHRSYIYKTGDLARWLRDGDIEFLGRIDNQVKIRGFRIEPGEIEKQLLNHLDIKEAVVNVHVDEPGDKYLSAYIVSDREVEIEGLREYLSRQLPVYMIPAYFTRVDRIPLTPNGKVDRQALPVPGTSRPKLKTTFKPAMGKLEKIIAELWKEVLKLDKVGINDSFFQLGGNSLNIVQLSNRLKETLKKDIPVLVLFKYFTISSFTKFLSGSNHHPGAARQKSKQLETLNQAVEIYKTTIKRFKKGVKT